MPRNLRAGRLLLGGEGRLLQIGPPARMHPPGAEHSPGRTRRRPWRAAQPPAELDQRTVGLGVVAPAAAGDDVLPDVLAAPALRDDVVDAGRRRRAVDTAPAVAGEHRAPREGNVHAVGDANEPGQPYDDRDSH